MYKNRTRATGYKRAKYSDRPQLKRARTMIPYQSKGELKFFDTVRATETIATTGTILNTSLNLIAEGTGEQNRVGRKCTVESVHLKGQVQLPAATSPTTDRVRLITILDKQANGGAAAVTDYLETADINSFRNLTELGRFTLLNDQTCDVNTRAGAGDSAMSDIYAPESKTIRVNKRLQIPLEFSASLGIISELRSNNIFVIALSQTGQATVSYTARIRFRG